LNSTPQFNSFNIHQDGEPGTMYGNGNEERESDASFIKPIRMHYGACLLDTPNRNSRLIAMALVFCVALALTSAAEKSLPVPGETFTVEDRQAFLILPEKPESSSPVPWVWYAPTLPGLPQSHERWMFEQFLRNGIAIAGVDVGESYGSPKGRAIYSALYDELVEKRGLASRACLLARSRGGLMLYCWAMENPDSVACIAGIYPVCNIASYPGVERACGAYGMTEEQLTAKLSEHNPIDRLAPLAKANVPIFHIHGDRDVVVPLEKNSGEVEKRYARLGGKMKLTVLEGHGHDMWSGWFQCQELVDFVIDHARNRSDVGKSK
jgi:pimeloyl-ACP methyl ester carboxylesterase